MHIANRHTLSRIIAVACLCAGFVQVSWATQTVTATLPEVNNAYGGPYPGPVTDAGSFSYTVPSGTPLISAIITGQFSNTQSTSSASSRIFLNGNLVATCGIDAPCTLSPLLFAFNIPTNQLPALAAGTADLTFIQDDGGEVRIGVTTLTLNFGAPTAVPTLDARMLGAMALLVALSGLWLARRHRRLASRH